MTTNPVFERPKLHATPAISMAFVLLFFGASHATAQAVYITCETCHAEQATAFVTSVHKDALRCPDCHGGRGSYEITDAEARQYGLGSADTSAPTTASATFEHGRTFRGRVPRAEVPTLCGSCHADVERMNPYGLRTDQLAAYAVSGHGKRLRETGDDRVAVCIDCHGTHDVLSRENPRSRTYFRNVATTCAQCHANAELMGAYDLPATIVAQYRASIHGRNVLEAGDAGSPNCATCHGSHGAAPPGFAQVGHVCGKCHQQIEQHFLSGVHGRIPGMVRCVGCHAKDGVRWNHQIEEASLPTEQLVALYERLEAEGVARAQRWEKFVETLSVAPGSLRVDQVCEYCHAIGKRPTTGHDFFLGENDPRALEEGRRLEAALRTAQFNYAETASRVDDMARGVLLVRDEALRVEDAKTAVMALYGFVHTLDESEIDQRAHDVKKICDEVNASLDEKAAGLERRRTSLTLVWVFIAIFVVLMYAKYLLLKHKYVRKAGAPAAASEQPLPGRRHVLNAGLVLMGATAVVALLWPAVTYMLPARKRGGAATRTSAGKESDWAEWAARKVSVGGKPVAVIRTNDGYRAFSAICTHLGCIVHWNQVGREFECPCHAAIFDANGAVVSGPPPRALPSYAVTVAQGEVYVSEAGG